MKKTFIHHNERSVIAVSGADAHKFLQGIISNDIGRAETSHSIYAFILTPQGKYLFDVFISFHENKYYIEVFSSLKAELLKKLKMYKLRSQVEIEDISDNFSIYSLFSDEFEGGNLGAKFTFQNGFAYTDPRSNALYVRSILPKNEVPAGFEVGDINEYNRLRIENNIPEGEYDLEREKVFPLHYRMRELNAVDFKKGCYVGQEVTARTHHRGEVRKTVYHIESPQPLEKNQDIIFNGVVVGKVLSCHQNLALAIIESEKAVNPANQLTINANPIKVFA